MVFYIAVCGGNCLVPSVTLLQTNNGVCVIEGELVRESEVERQREREGTDSTEG